MVDGTLVRQNAACRLSAGAELVIGTTLLKYEQAAIPENDRE
jgi:hypothetical protein